MFRGFGGDMRARIAGFVPAALRLEALGQSVQADVFHLYSLIEGAVYASVFQLGLIAADVPLISR